MAKGKTRKRKIASKLRVVIASNVRNLARKLFKDHPNLPVAIKEASGNAFSKSTAQRIMEGKVGTSLEQLDALGKALEVAPYQLLITDLDPDNPQVAKGATADEQVLYKRIAREAAEEVLSRSTPGNGPAQEKK